MDLESKRPLRPLFRVGRNDDAWTVPDWAYAKEDGTFGNRSDASLDRRSTVKRIPFENRKPHIQ